MKKMKKILLLLVSILSSTILFSQIIINEASNKNASQIQNSKGEFEDWIEIYNAGNSNVDLSNYYLSDGKKNLLQWKFPNNTYINPQSYLLVFAANTPEVIIPQTNVNHWETAVKEDDTWRWINPDASTSTSWMATNFDDNSWTQGQGGFGFVDDDDVTIFDAANVSVYTRIAFQITDVQKILDAVLHIDYDDGFVAYLNGVEIARSNISGTPTWDINPDGTLEALMYQGQNPTEIKLDMNVISSIVTQGTNVLAIECHNGIGSSDMSLRPFLSFGLSDNSTQFGPTPSWFNLQGNPQTGDLVTNFKISSKGETVYLSNANSVILDSLVVPSGLSINYSVGSVTDGSLTKAIYTIATPNASNNTQTAYPQGYEVSPTFSLQAGIYNTSKQLQILSGNPLASIYYTVNGEEPNQSSTQYTGTITISQSEVVKAICISNNKIPSHVTTATYIIEPTQTNAGILSISTTNENLFGNPGIITNWGGDTKVPCYIEYFAPTTHTKVISQNAGLKVDGGAGGSRSNPQTSFRVEPGNGLFGDGDIKYQIIPSISRDSYETFYIRNGSNQYMYYPCKDAIETTLLANGTKNNNSAYTPINVYINGQYWGYYELREKQDADYFKQHYNINPDELELLSLTYWYNGQLRAIVGDTAVEHFTNDYNTFNSLNTASSTFWDNANKLVDLEYYTDYICAQSWIADTDWPYNNIKIFRGPETKNRWRFGIVDVEWSLQPQGWTSGDFNHIEYITNYDPNLMFIHLWQKAMENQTYKNYFINRFADLMNTAWLPDSTNAIANGIYNSTRPELERSFARWGQGDINSTDNAHQIMLQELTNRSDYVRQHIVNQHILPKQVTVTLNVSPANAGIIKISTIVPKEFPWTGVYFDGVPVTIEAIPYAGYTFDKWDANTIITQLNNAKFNNVITKNCTFYAHFKTKQNSEQIVVSEINYNSAPNLDAEDWVEFWNYNSTLEANLTGCYFTDSDIKNKYYFPENTIIPPNGRIVVAYKPHKFEKYYPGLPYLADIGFNFSNYEDAILLYNHDNELISEVAYSDHLPWTITPDGQGYTLELKDENGVMTNASNWFAGCFGGSPTVAPSSNCIPTEINTIKEVSQIQISPNPAKDKITIWNNSSQNKLKQYSINDVQGRIIKSGEFTNDFTIDISQITTGIYFIKLFGNETVQTLKFVVIK